MAAIAKPPQSIFKILGKALKLTTKNPTLILHLQLISFLSSFILFTTTYLLLTPLSDDITAKSAAISSLDPTTPEYASYRASIFKDLKDMVGVELIIALVSFLLYSLISFATIHTFSVSYTGELLNPKSLFSRVFKKLKGPLITRLYVALLSVGYTLLVVALVTFTAVSYNLSSSIFVLVVGVLLFILSLVGYLYLSMVWSVSVVVSVVEKDGMCYGRAAIMKAGEVIEGRRRQAGLLNLVMMIVVGVVLGAYNIGNGLMNSGSVTGKLGIGVVYALLSVLIGLFNWAVVMVFYCDCKESKGEEGIGKMIDVDGGFMYHVVDGRDAQLQF